MLSDLLKNPILIGIAIAAATYFYMKWDRDNKHKKNPKMPKKRLSFLIPGIVGVIAWYIAANYFESAIPINQEVPNMAIENKITPTIVQTNIPNIGTINRGGRDTLSLSDRSYQLVSKGKINIPTANALEKNLPEMFLELNNF